MVTELQSEQRELAEYIRAGSTRGPQCFGSYFDEKGGSCALGAVYDAFYHLPRQHGRLIPQHPQRLFGGLAEVTNAARTMDVRNDCRLLRCWFISTMTTCGRASKSPTGSRLNLCN